jgi:hypothetical protein
VQWVTENRQACAVARSVNDAAQAEATGNTTGKATRCQGLPVVHYWWRFLLPSSMSMRLSEVYQLRPLGAPPMRTPDLLTITEAAAVLRIGRTASYELARRDLASDGGEGLGVVRVGGQLRVPRASLERLVGGPLSWPLAGPGPGADGAGAAPLDSADLTLPFPS